MIEPLNRILSQQVINYLSMLLPLVLLLIGMTFAVLIDSYISKRQKLFLFLAIAFSFCHIIESNLNVYMNTVSLPLVFRTANSVFGYSIRPVILVLFCGILSPDRNYLPEWILVGVNAALYLTAFFCPLTFYYIEGGFWVPGPLRSSCLVVSVFLLGELLFLTIRKYRKIRGWEAFIPVFSILMIIGSVVLDYSIGSGVQIVSFLTIAIVLSSLFFYIWLHLQFVREHEKDLLAQQKIQIMVSQIQPHFIYNSLTAIRSYVNEPEKAEEAIDNFTAFLRGSIDLLDSAECIPAGREFGTVDNYLYLEKARFGDKLTVMADFQNKDFLLPAFSVQTLVENAIRHGIRKNKGGRGTLTIKSYESDRENIIEVRDDGVGFDKVKVKNNPDNHKHIGLVNLKSRLKIMCNGRVEIESEPGHGTIAHIYIPKKTKGQSLS